MRCVMQLKQLTTAFCNLNKDNLTQGAYRVISIMKGARTFLVY